MPQGPRRCPAVRVRVRALWHRPRSRPVPGDHPRGRDPAVRARAARRGPPADSGAATRLVALGVAVAARVAALMATQAGRE
ncbi:hypothetical protein ACFXA8_28360, partial [Streptomyces sp. NPDC059409]